MESNVLYVNDSIVRCSMYSYHENTAFDFVNWRDHWAAGQCLSNLVQTINDILWVTFEMTRECRCDGVFVSSWIDPKSNVEDDSPRDVVNIKAIDRNEICSLPAVKNDEWLLTLIMLIVYPCSKESNAKSIRVLHKNFDLNQIWEKHTHTHYKTVSLKPLRDKNELIGWCIKHVWGRKPMDPSSSFWTSKVDFPMRFNTRTWSPRRTENVFVPLVWDNIDLFSYSFQTRKTCFEDELSWWIDDDDDDEYVDDENDVRRESRSIAARFNSPKTFECVGKVLIFNGRCEWIAMGFRVQSEASHERFLRRFSCNVRVTRPIGRESERFSYDFGRLDGEESDDERVLENFW